MEKREMGIEDMRLIPPGPGKCPECAVEHPSHEPHDAQSLYYQMKFRQQRGRFPTWRDAMAHCDSEMQDTWIAALMEFGIQVPEIETPTEQNAPSARNA